MKDELLQLFPEIGLIGNASLQKNVIDTYHCYTGAGELESEGTVRDPHLHSIFRNSFSPMPIMCTV